MNKQILFILGIALMSFQACNSQTEKSQTSSAAEVSATPASLGENTEVVTVPVHITKADFLANVMNYEKNTEVWTYEGELPCIVDFYATWCPPCKVSDPILEKLAEDYAGKIKIYKVDVDKEEELAAVFGISSIPTFLFCPVTGNPTMSSGIAQTPEATESMFRQQIDQILLQ